MPLKPEVPKAFFEHTPWEDEPQAIWLTSSLHLARNLAKLKYPHKLAETDMQALYHNIQEVLQRSQELKDPVFFSAPLMSSLEREFLFEHFLCLEIPQNLTVGQGFVIDESREFLGYINIKDHLQLNLTSRDADLTKVWSKLSKIESEVSQSFEMAFSPKFGYLTADPRQSGTALIVYIYLHLPGLIHTDQIQETLEKQKDESIDFLSLEGGLENFPGDILILRNHYTLGLSEETIIHSLQSHAMKLMAAEKAIRAHFKAKLDTGIKDKISRAYGLLFHSYQLHTKEALNALSLIKLGIDLDWILGVNSAKINEIFFRCRRAHLTYWLKEDTLDFPDIARRRAEFVHDQLKDMHMRDG